MLRDFAPELYRQESARLVRYNMAMLGVSRAAVYRWLQQGRALPVIKTSDLPLLTARQAADMLQVKIGTIYKWAAAGRLPSLHVSRCLRFRLRDLKGMVLEDDLLFAVDAG